MCLPDEALPVRSSVFVILRAEDVKPAFGSLSVITNLYCPAGSVEIGFPWFFRSSAPVELSEPVSVPSTFARARADLPGRRPCPTWPCRGSSRARRRAARRGW